MKFTHTRPVLGTLAAAALLGSSLLGLAGIDARNGQSYMADNAISYQSVDSYHVAMEINRRLMNIFLRDEKGKRAVYGDMDKFQTDPYWKDLILFHEYFHGDNGAGLGANHQTGWTGVIAKLIELFGRIDAAQLLKVGKPAAFATPVEDHSTLVTR